MGLCTTESSEFLETSELHVKLASAEVVSWFTKKSFMWDWRMCGDIFCSIGPAWYPPVLCCWIVVCRCGLSPRQLFLNPQAIRVGFIKIHLVTVTQRSRYRNTRDLLSTNVLRSQALPSYISLIHFAFHHSPLPLSSNSCCSKIFHDLFWKHRPIFDTVVFMKAHMGMLCMTICPLTTWQLPFLTVNKWNSSSL